MAFNQDIKALVPRTALPATFLRAAIYHARGRLLSRIVPSAHGTMTLNLHDVENLSVSVPDDINEAKAIASVLHFAQGAISVEGRHLAALRDFKRAILGELFSRGLQRETSKDSDIGKIPQSWTVTTLGALISEGAGRIQTGPFGSQLHAHEYQSSGIPIVNPTHLAGNKINHEEVPRISEERAKSLSRHFLREGDLLFARRGEIGRLGLVNQGEVGWLCGTGCFLVRVRHDHICNSFLARFFSTDGVIAWLKANAAGAIMPNLNNVVLAKVPVAYPTVDEQRRITSILSTLDRKIDVQERKGEALAMLSRALTHKLMTGTISVDQLDYSALRKEGASP